jgi:zinc protease
MNRWIAYLALASVAGACAPAAPPASTPRAPVAPSGTAPGPDYSTSAPALGPAPTLRLPTPVRRSLANGMTVIYVPKRDLPVVQATLLSRGGLSDDPAQLPGLAAFAAAMLDEGAGGRSALELAEAVEQLGATLSTGAGWDAAQINLQVLRGRFPDALALMADVAVRPDFPEREIQRLRDERLTELARGRDEARVVAGNAFTSLVYGGNHPYGRVTTTETVRRIDRRALVNFHRRHFSPASSTLILVGDVDEGLHGVVERAFGGWRGAAPAAPAALATPATAASRIYLVDMPGAAQSEIRIGHPGVTRDNPDFYALTVMNTLLGGSFTSRLMQNLRETHGYTYGAGSSFQMRRGAGPFMATSAVVTAKTDSAVIEFFNELNRIRDEAVPADELERAKNFVALRLPQNFETTGQIAARIAELVMYDLPLDYYENYVQRVMAVTAADVQRVAREYVHPGRSAVVVVGDRQTIEAGLRALPVGQVEVRRIDEFVR